MRSLYSSVKRGNKGYFFVELRQVGKLTLVREYQEIYETMLVKMGSSIRMDIPRDRYAYTWVRTESWTRFCNFVKALISI